MFSSTSNLQTFILFSLWLPASSIDSPFLMIPHLYFLMIAVTTLGFFFLSIVPFLHWLNLVFIFHPKCHYFPFIFGYLNILISPWLLASSFFLIAVTFIYGCRGWCTIMSRGWVIGVATRFASGTWWPTAPDAVP